jgi:hypothetical protein
VALQGNAAAKDERTWLSQSRVNAIAATIAMSKKEHRDRARKASGVLNPPQDETD